MIGWRRFRLQWEQAMREGALQAMVERMRDSKHGESAAIVVCVIAFAIMGCVGGILNASVYSRVAEYYGIAREISTMTSGFCS
ncbi:MAG: hypothetical protein ACLSVD_16900 [Eggerthellaceae bacterium]